MTVTRSELQAWLDTWNENHAAPSADSVVDFLGIELAPEPTPPVGQRRRSPDGVEVIKTDDGTNSWRRYRGKAYLSWFTGAKDTIIAGFKWYYILVVALFLFFAVYLMFSRFGSIRLGDDDQVPEFGYFAWFSMLFSAGMGIGLVFWSIGFAGTGGPWVTWALGDLAVKLLVGVWLLLPFRLLMARRMG